MKTFLHPTPISKFFFSPKPHHHHLTSTPFFHIHHFSTTPTATPSHPYRRNEEEIRNVRVSVWWDFENCGLPTNCNAFKVAQFITAAVRANGIKGPVSITAFGDVLQLSRDTQSALFATGITLTHIPNGGKNSADRSLFVDLMYWVSQNPPPAHLFLVSGDQDLASVLHRLRMSNYNILLASSDCAPGVLCSAASIMWQWSALVRGENLTGKYFNQPPDGPYASWYGRYNSPLADPFAVAGQPSNIRANDVSECGPDMLFAIPDTVMKQICNILNSCPKGISTADLRLELEKSNVSIDKSYFGYRKFSRFLLAMPHILKLEPDTATGTQYIVHGVPTKIYGENDPTTRSSVGPLATKEGQSSFNAVNQNGQKSSSKESTDVKPLQRVVSEQKVSGSPTKPPESMKVHELPKPYTEGPSGKLSQPLSQVQIVGTPKMQDCRKSQKPSEDAEETARVVQEASQVHMVRTPKMQDCKKSQQPSEGAQETASVVQEANKTEVTNSELLLATDDHSSVSKLSVFGKILKWWSGSENGVYNAKKSTVVDTTSGPGVNTKEKKEAKVSDNEATVDNSAQASSLVNKITRSLEASEKSKKPDSSSHRLFSKVSFWNDMKAFLNTPKGVGLVLKAETRSQMGQALARDGPPALTSLSDDELLQLVDMLISDKKWVEESASPSCLFKFRFSNLGCALITDAQLQSGSLRRHQFGGENICQNPHAEVAQPAIPKLGGKSRSEILADCKNLVQFIMKAHPEGFNISLFEDLFVDKFGYPLEFQNLGYTKLDTLLQIMPGIRIDSGLIIPSGKGLHASVREKPSGKLTEEPQKDEGNESSFAELGPVVGAVSDEKTTKSKAKENMKGRVQHHCELLSDDDLSDSSEDETTFSSKMGGKKQRKGTEGDSSFLKILDTYHGSKDDSIGTSNSEIVDSSDEDVEDGSHGTSDGCRSGTANGYCSSVPDQQGNKETLIDIVRTMVKPGEIK